MFRRKKNKKHSILFSRSIFVALMSSNRSKRAEISQDTIDRLSRLKHKYPNWSKPATVIDINKLPTADSLFSEKEGEDPLLREDLLSQIEEGRSREKKASPVVVKTGNVLDVTLEEVRVHPRILVLNLASEKNPGGGWLEGSQAQEEDLFRGTSISLTLSKEKHYPIGRNRCLLSEHVGILRDGSQNWLSSDDRAESKYVEVAVLTLPAIRRPQLVDGKYRWSDLSLMQKKIGAIFRVAAMLKVDVVIAGALGCGAFKNPIESVARLFSLEIATHRWHLHFKKIVFAILEEEKAKVFRDAFAVAKLSSGEESLGEGSA